MDHKYADMVVRYGGNSLRVSRIFLAKASRVFGSQFTYNPDVYEIIVDMHFMNILSPKSIELFFAFFSKGWQRDTMLEHKYDMFKLAEFYEVESLAEEILRTYVDGDLITQDTVVSIAEDYESMCEYPTSNPTYHRLLHFLLWRLQCFYTQKQVMFEKKSTDEHKWLHQYSVSTDHLKWFRSYRLPQHIRNTYIMSKKSTTSKVVYMSEEFSAWKPSYTFYCNINAGSFFTTAVNDHECGVPLYLSFKRKFSDVLYFGIASTLSVKHIQYRLYVHIEGKIRIDGRCVETFDVYFDFHLTDNKDNTREFLYHQLSITNAVLEVHVKLLAMCEEPANNHIWLSDKFLSNSVVLNRLCTFQHWK